MEFTNRYVPGADNSNNGGTAGLEIYDQTYQQLLNHWPYYGTNDGILFSTKELRGAPVQSFRTLTDVPTSSYTYRYTYKDGSKMDECNPPGVPVNPFLFGYMGNWRPYQSKVYQETRKYNDVFAAGNKNMDVKNAGYFNSFNPWWRYQNGLWIENNSSKWVTANTITLYDKYGQELENKDALGRYSAASFDFSGQLPAAVASNAMNREIYVNSFEDTKFRATDNPATLGEFLSASSGTAINSLTDPLKSHSGNYSLSLNSTGILLNTILHTNQHQTGNYIMPTSKGYQLLGGAGLYPNGFEPLPAQKYILNVWVKDAQPASKTVNIAVAIKGEHTAPTTVALSCKAIVEGWKLLEGEINTALISGSKLQLTMKATGATVNVDDIRIHPKNALMKSYAYDDKNFKLMAELDENAFATFYEYDDEGSLVRVKKETERGIMTIKENRSSYKKTIIQ